MIAVNLARATLGSLPYNENYYLFFFKTNFTIWYKETKLFSKKIVFHQEYWVEKVCRIYQLVKQALPSESRGERLRRRSYSAQLQTQLSILFVHDPTLSFNFYWNENVTFSGNQPYQYVQR